MAPYYAEVEFPDPSDRCTGRLLALWTSGQDGPPNLIILDSKLIFIVGMLHISLGVLLTCLTLKNHVSRTDVKAAPPSTKCSSHNGTHPSQIEKDDGNSTTKKEFTGNFGMLLFWAMLTQLISVVARTNPTRISGQSGAARLVMWQAVSIMVQALWWAVSSAIFKEQHFARSTLLVGYVQLYFSVGASLQVARLDVGTFEFWIGIVGVVSIELYRDSYFWFHYQDFLRYWCGRGEKNQQNKVNDAIGIFHWNMQAGRIERLSIFACAGILCAEWQGDTSALTPPVSPWNGHFVMRTQFSQVHTQEMDRRCFA